MDRIDPRRRKAPAFILAAAALLLGAAMFADPGFSRLFILEGTWKMETRRGPLFERWTKIDDSTLRGISYRIPEDDTLTLERIELSSRPEGIFYIPTVTDQNDGKPVRFRLVSSEADRFVFENPEHDFPQRIIYTVITQDSIVARIEGISGGKPAGSDFYFRRIAGK